MIVDASRRRQSPSSRTSKPFLPNGTHATNRGSPGPASRGPSAFLGVTCWSLLGGVENARRNEGVRRRAGGRPRTTWRPTGAGPMTTTWPRAPGSPAASPPPTGGWPELAPLTGDGYEAWVAGRDPDTGEPRGRLRTDERAVRFVEVVVNGPKSWSLAAALHPDIAAAYDAAQDRAADADHRLARRARDHPGRSARRAGAGAGGGAGGGDGAALHLPRRGSAPASAPADQRPGVRRREMARAAHRRRPRLARRDQRHRARRGRLRPGVPGRAGRARLHPGRDWRNTGSSPSTSVRSARGRRRSRRNMDRYEARMDRRRTPANTRARRCGGRGTRGRGPRAARTRSSRSRARTSTARWRAELAALGYRDRDRPVDLTPDPGRRAGPRRRGRAGAGPAGRRPLGVERRRRPRRGRAADRRRGHRRRRGGAHRAGRGPHRPRPGRLRAAAGPRRGARAHPGLDLPAGARRRGRPDRPARRPRRRPPDRTPT